MRKTASAGFRTACRKADAVRAARRRPPAPQRFLGHTRTRSESMQKLTKAHLTSRDQLIEDLNDTYEALEDAVSAYNTTLAEAWNEVLSAEEAYNDATQAAQEWLNDRAAEIQASIDARSEQWQDSDRGKAYGAW